MQEVLTQFFHRRLFVGEYFEGEWRRDIVLRGDAWEIPEELAAVILGGLAISKLFTLIRLPGLLTLGESASFQVQAGDTIAS